MRFIFAVLVLLIATGIILPVVTIVTLTQYTVDVGVTPSPSSSPSTHVAKLPDACTSSFYERVCNGIDNDKHESVFRLAMRGNARTIESIVPNDPLYPICMTFLSNDTNLVLPKDLNDVVPLLRHSEKEELLTRVISESSAFFYVVEVRKNPYVSSYARVYRKNENACAICKDEDWCRVWFEVWCTSLPHDANNATYSANTRNFLKITEEEMMINDDDTLKVIGGVVKRLSFMRLTERHFRPFIDGTYALALDLHVWRREGVVESGRLCRSFVRKYAFERVNRAFYERTETGDRVTRGKVKVILEEIKKSLKRVIRRSPWMSWNSSTSIGRKIDAIEVSVISPPTARHSSEYLPNGEVRDVMLNAVLSKQRALLASSALSRNYLDDRLHWSEVYDFHRTPFETVNAWYSPITNTITVPPGILQDPVFSVSPTFKQKVFVGAIVGHELGHSVDVNGLLFGSMGNYRGKRGVNMGSREVKRWRDGMTCLQDEYASFCDSAYVASGELTGDYGSRTLGENIADQLGVETSLDYFKTKLLGECSGRPIDNVMERCAKDFFESYATIWCTWGGDDDGNNKLTVACDGSEKSDVDVHAKPQHRVDVALRQNQIFKRYYGCDDSCYMSNPKPCLVYS